MSTETPVEAFADAEPSKRGDGGAADERTAKDGDGEVEPYVRYMSTCQIWSYAAPSFSTVPVTVFLSVYGIQFYEKIGAQLGYVAFFQALARGFDVITDPTMSWITDKHRSNDGRRRPFIKTGAASSPRNFASRIPDGATPTGNAAPREAAVPCPQLALAPPIARDRPPPTLVRAPARRAAPRRAPTLHPVSAASCSAARRSRTPHPRPPPHSLSVLPASLSVRGAVPAERTDLRVCARPL